MLLWQVSFKTDRHSVYKEKKMKDAAAEIIAIRQATRQLQTAVAAMTLTQTNAELIRDSIAKLQAATTNLNVWLNDQQVLQ